MNVTLILLQTLNGIISLGPKDRLDWGGKADKSHFRNRTLEVGTMIMGSNTFKAMGMKSLPNRKTIVMTSTPSDYSSYQSEQLTFTSTSPIALLEELQNQGVGEVVVAGGANIYRTFLEAKLIDYVEVSIASKIAYGGIPAIKLDDVNFETDNNENNVEQNLVDLKFVKTEMLDENTILIRYKVLK